jgi:hypothetical protein
MTHEKRPCLGAEVDVQVVVAALRQAWAKEEEVKQMGLSSFAKSIKGDVMAEMGHGGNWGGGGSGGEMGEWKELGELRSVGGLGR